jgi:hypothetical protein
MFFSVRFNEALVDEKLSNLICRSPNPVAGFPSLSDNPSGQSSGSLIPHPSDRGELTRATAGQESYRILCPDQTTIARLRTGNRQPANSPSSQVAIMDTVALQTLYCVEPPMARMRTL